jgi:hypothetical protein
MSNPEIFREKMIAAAAKLPKGSAILLSGGLDSGSLLAAAKRAGVSFSIYTASFGEYPSIDNKLARIRAKAVAPEAPFERIAVPRSETYAQETMEWVIRRSGASVKSAIEVMMVMRHVIDSLKGKHPAIVTSMASGCLWGLSRENCFEYSRTGDEGWTKARKIDYAWEFNGYPPNATRVSRDYCSELGIEWLDPMTELADWMLSLGFKELHTKPGKILTVQAFPELGRTKTQQGGLQVIGGVREYMQILAEQRGFKSALAWYTDTARKLGLKPRGDDRHRAAWSTKK